MVLRLLHALNDLCQACAQSAIPPGAETLPTTELKLELSALTAYSLYELGCWA